MCCRSYLLSVRWAIKARLLLWASMLAPPNMAERSISSWTALEDKELAAKVAAIEAAKK